MRIFVLVCFMLFTNMQMVFAWHPSIMRHDSLHHLLHGETAPLNHARVYNHLARHYIDKKRDLDSMRYYAELTTDLVTPPRSFTEEDLLVQNLFLLAYYQIQKQAPDIAFVLYHNIQDVIWRSVEREKHLDNYALLCRYKARIFFSQKNIPAAISTIKEFDAFRTLQGIEDHIPSSRLYFDLSMYFTEAEKFDSALFYYERGVEAALKLNEKKVLRNKKRLYASILMSLGRIEEAEVVLKALLPEARKSANLLFQANTYLNMSILSDSLGRSDDRLRFLQKAFEAARQSNALAFEADIGSRLGLLLHERGEDAKAFPIYKKYTDILMKNLDENLQHAVQQSSLDQKNKLIEIQLRENTLKEEAIQQKNKAIYFAWLFAVSALLIGLFYFRSYKRKKQLSTKLSFQKHQLEELNESQKRLFSNVSHELRTPLTLISSPLRHMLQTDHEHFSGDTLANLQRMDRSCIQLQKLVEDILSLSQLAAGQIENTLTSVNILSLCKQLVFDFQPLAEHLTINLYERSACTEAHKLFMLDYEKCKRILYNLLSNAMKHTPAGGEVILTVRCSSESLHFIVTDTGCGIDSSEIERVFERYYQSRHPNTSFQGGTGIGLAFAREMACVMNGKLLAESKKGQGSTFTLILPRIESGIPIEAFDLELSYDTPYHSLKRRTISRHVSEEKPVILLVEDNLDMQDYLAQLLKQSYDIYRALNGEEAIKQLSEHKVDLIITDVMMPGMDGFTFLERIKTDNDLSAIPVIMLTALNEERDRLKALTIGVDDYIIKPFSAKELQIRVRNMMTNHLSRKAALQDFSKPAQHAITPIDLDDEQDADIHVSLQNGWVKEVADVLKNELENKDFHISDLAEQFNLGERQFQRRIKAVTGLTPKQFQQEVALQQARYLLENRQYGNPSAVALSVGIGHVTRFSRLYEGRFGKKPKEYFS